MDDKIEAINYEELGFRCGLEIHYQLDTKKKLFCNCPVGLKNDRPDAEIIRHMRPTLSELGEYDGTALMEFKTKKEIHYQLHYDSVCTYEMDDTPPFSVNQAALKIAIEIALLLNCQIADEIHVSRKQYLDGSIPTGFQRTIAIGVNGWIPFRGRRIKIMQLCLEEDACREIKDEEHIIVFRTDRLSTPLVEVITYPDMRTPDEAMEVDRELGRILRATGKVKRGIGTVRQDVNVSIKGGTRVEIKGVPQTKLIKSLVHFEAIRQKSLLSLKEELHMRGLSAETISFEKIDCTEILKDTKSTAIQKSLKIGGVVGAIKLSGFAGLLNYKMSPYRTFADELRGRVRVIACLDKPPILFHSDEKRENQPSPEEWQKVKKTLDVKYTDALIIVWGNKNDVNTAISEIVIRVKEATLGIPNETRQVLRTGETDFERILPGPNRMYPDTDSAPIPISEKIIEHIKELLPETPDYWRKKYKKTLNPQMIEQLIVHNLIKLFSEIYEGLKIEPNFIAHTLNSTFKMVNGKRNFLAKENLIPLFKKYKEKTITRSALQAILIEMVNGKHPLSEILVSLKLKMISSEETRNIIREELKNKLQLKHFEKRIEFLIGRIKGRIGNYADGNEIMQILREELE
jgi:glutamyl-tRNA(Gln) amidotransferase subunit E